MLSIEFLSTAGWLPEDEATDTVSLLINRHILVDTGWHCVRNLLRTGVQNISSIDTVLFTHMHQDHYISLPSLLFYFFNGYHDAGTLSVYGPPAVDAIMEQAMIFAGRDQHYKNIPMPRVNVLSPGDSLSLPDVTISTIASHHAVRGLSYCFTDPQTNRRVVYSGDTAPFTELKDFALNADVLIHECSWGAWRDPENPNTCCHSSAEDAALCAKEARVGTLYLVHSAQKNIQSNLSVAQPIFPNTMAPANNARVTLE